MEITLSRSYYKEEKNVEDENDKYSNPGDLEIIWSSSVPASYNESVFFLFIGENSICESHLERGNLEAQCAAEQWWDSLQGISFPLQYDLNQSLSSPLAGTSKLFERDNVWVVTQNMVSPSTPDLWSVHRVRDYRVYPWFWGRSYKKSCDHYPEFLESLS